MTRPARASLRRPPPMHGRVSRHRRPNHLRHCLVGTRPQRAQKPAQPWVPMRVWMATMPPAPACMRPTMPPWRSSSTGEVSTQSWGKASAQKRGRSLAINPARFSPARCALAIWATESRSTAAFHANGHPRSCLGQTDWRAPRAPWRRRLPAAPGCACAGHRLPLDLARAARLEWLHRINVVKIHHRPVTDARPMCCVDQDVSDLATQPPDLLPASAQRRRRRA